MYQKLPAHGFAWVLNTSIFDKENIAKLVRKNVKGYILEVAVEYLKELHRLHDCLPFLPEKMKLGEIEKLVPNLKNKKK